MNFIQLENAKACVTWWTLSGDVQHDALCRVVEALSLDTTSPPPLPSVSTDVALRRALKTFESRHVLVRSPKRGSDMYAIVRETWTFNGPRYEVLAQVKAVEMEEEIELVWEGSEHEEITFELLGIAFRQALGAYAPEDLSAWLATYARNMQAARIRETGGIYYIPEVYGDQWRDVRKCVNAHTSHTIYELPVATTESAIEAVVAALENEVEKALVVAADTAQSRGIRAIEHQRNMLAQLSNRVRFFENAFGKGLSFISDKIERVDAACVVAAIREQN